MHHVLDLFLWKISFHIISLSTKIWGKIWIVFWVKENLVLQCSICFNSHLCHVTSSVVMTQNNLWQTAIFCVTVTSKFQFLSRHTTPHCLSTILVLFVPSPHSARKFLYPGWKCVFPCYTHVTPNGAICRSRANIHLAGHISVSKPSVLLNQSINSLITICHSASTCMAWMFFITHTCSATSQSFNLLVHLLRLLYRASFQHME